MIRKRGHATADDRDGAAHPPTDLDDDSSYVKMHRCWCRAHQHRRVSVAQFVLAASLLLISATFTWSVARAKRRYNLNVDVTETVKVDKPSPELKDWSHCNNIVKTTYQISNSKIDKVKVEPLWLPAYPTSLPGDKGDIYSQFLTVLTGLDTAFRNYYRQSKTLKRCHSLNDDSIIGVTCEIVHPIVPCQRPHPSDQSDNFGEAVLLALRNPASAFPAFHQEKAVKYHGVKGQVEREQWISFRDEYLGNATSSHLFEEWKNFIMEWRSMKPYHVAMYLPYEDWFDETKGKILVKRLSEVLKTNGFPVLNSGDTANDALECAWRKNMYEVVMAEEGKRKEEGWYTPDYTTDQKLIMANHLERFASEIKDVANEERPGDDNLIAILNEYRKSILDSV